MANLARDWGFSWFPCGLATAATLQTLHFPARKCFTALPIEAPTTDHKLVVVLNTANTVGPCQPLE